MKIRYILIITAVIFSLLPLIYAQCPTICDNHDNTALGQNALVNNRAAKNNTAVGSEALQNNNAEGNTATGYRALRSNRIGAFNTAYGVRALSSITTTQEETALGAFALANLANGSSNTAVGYQALASSTTVYNNTAVGWSALTSNTTGSSEVAVGSGALEANTTGWENVAVGDSALKANTDGQFNTAVGHTALYDNTSGDENTALGSRALLGNTTGTNNIALGADAGINLTTGNYNIEIGHSGVAAESNTIRIGTQGTQTVTFIAGIWGTAITGGIPVGVSSSGQLGVAPSSQRFKQNIQPMDKASEAILALKPVTFRYKKELDPDGILQFGLVAEQVEKVNPDLVARDDEGKPYTVRYEAVNAMLLNEFLKAHRKVEALEATVAVQQKGFEAQQKKSQTTAQEQQQEIAALTAALKEQAAQIQKVSDQLGAQVQAPRVVGAND